MTTLRTLLTRSLALLPLTLAAGPLMATQVAAEVPAAASEAGLDAELAARLERLAESLEQARERAHVPGMSLAVVKDDRVVWSGGFGLADLESGRAADARTIYAVGSTTKAFTATLIGMLADEGRLDWDDPVTAHLPWFDLAVQSDDPDAACTLRDLLSHRHGFSRMSMLWAGGGQVSRDEILRTAANAEPFAEFRKGFNYCNVTYLAAGVSAGVAAGSDWDTLMRTRLLEPLGMEASTLSVAAASADERLATGYRWHESASEHAPMPMLELAHIAPAGAINSNVLDMARWVRFQLARGELDGRRLISTERLEDTWEPQVAIGQGVEYGLGWMLREHGGHRVVEHGGNIDGFSAQVTLVPEQGLGYVLLLNLDATPLREASIGLVLNALLDDASSTGAPVAADGSGVEAVEGIEAAAAAPDLSQYTGVYVANFASFKDEEFEVTAADGRLTLDIPSQQAFALLPPDAEGRWQFELTDQIAVVFDRGADGEVVGITLYQGPYTFEIPREGVEPPPEVPLEQLQPYVGSYLRDEGGRQVEIAIRRNRLGLVDKGQWVAFHPPGEDGHAALRVRADQGATFHRAADGTVDSFTFHGDAGDKRFTRTATAPAEALPTVEALLELRGIVDLSTAGGSRTTGALYLPQAGLHGTFTFLAQGDDRYARHMDFGKFGRVDIVARGGRAWRSSEVRGLEELLGKELGQALLEHPAAVTGDWREVFDPIEVLRNEPVHDRPAHVVRLGHPELPDRTYWVDAETGDVVRAKLTVLERTMRIPVTIDYADFETAPDGTRYATRMVIENPASGRTMLTVESYEAGLELGDEAFELGE